MGRFWGYQSGFACLRCRKEPSKPLRRRFASLQANVDAQYHCSLPSTEYPPAALAFLPNNPNILVVGLINNAMHIYDVERATFASWARDLNSVLPALLSDLRETMIGIAFEPLPSLAEEALYAPLTMIVWGANYMAPFCLPAKSAQLQNDQHVGRPNKRSLISCESKTEDKSITTIASLTGGRVTHKYKSLLGVEFLAHGELCVVERPFMNLLPDLPPAFYSPRYGRG